MKILFAPIPILIGVEAGAAIEVAEYGPAFRVESPRTGESVHLIFSDQAELIGMAAALLQATLALPQQAVLAQARHNGEGRPPSKLGKLPQH